jgi:stage III sporulation protein AA
VKKERVKAEILDRLPGPTGETLLRLYHSDSQGNIFEHLKEIRIRAYQPLLLVTDTEEIAPGREPDAAELTELLQSLCKNSMYAFETSIREGFVTIEGGHRIGLAGRYIEGKGIVDIGSLNIRISCEIKGCANGILPSIKRDKKDIYNTLILSPPCCGKTTMLRDLARSLSWSGFNVGVVDERSEIAGSYMGVSANDMGPRCDIYDTCPKSTGIYMMLRAMSPDVIVTDEIGGSRDIDALRQASWAGVRLIASCHGFGEADISNSGLREIFDKVVVLSSRNGPGTVERIVQT